MNAEVIPFEEDSVQWDVVLARDLYPEKLEGDEPEELDVVPWPIADLHSLTAREDCTEGRTIAALYIARDHLQGLRNDD